MPITALVFIIIAALFHATWNLVAKKSGGGVTFAFCSGVFTLCIWTPVVITLVSLRPDLSFISWGYQAWGVITLSAVIHAVYYVVLLHGYRVAPLSIVYPVARGTGPLISASVAIVLFKELLTINTIFGILIIVFGIVMLTWQKGNIDLADKSFLNGVRWGGLTGLTIASYTIVDSYGVKVLKMDPVLFDYWGNMFRVFILFPFVIGHRPEIFKVFKGDFRGLLVIAILGPLAYMLVLYAVQIAPVSHVAPARELSLMFGAFFGGKILKEGHLARRMFAAGLIAFGVVLLAF